MDSKQDESEREDFEKLEFEWHSLKAVGNLKKHAVSLDEARTVFGDKSHLEIPEREHSNDEPRFLAIGRTDCGIHGTRKENASD